MNQQAILRRTHFLWALLVLAGGIISVRLFYLQVLQHDYYEAQAVAEHQKKFRLPANRGVIYGWDGDKVTPLVMNEPVFLLYADPRYVRDPKVTAAELAKTIGGDIREYEQKLSNDKLSYVVLAKKLNKAQADAIEKAELYGVGLTQSERRVYPEGQLAAQVLGFVNDEGKGQYGLESALNSQLYGTDGLLKAITDVRGIPLTITDQNILKPAKDGANIVTTIDRNIQAYAEEALRAGLDRVKATKGSALVMDPHTGKVLAMANAPTYDPANYTQVDDYAAFQNAIISQPYEVGSVMKALTMAVGLNEGVIRKDDTFQNTNEVKVADATIKNVVKHAGTTTMTQILQLSLNTGVVHILKQLGGGELNLAAREKIYQYFTEHFKFEKLTGVELASEASGYLFGPKEVQGNNVRYANMTFGQGMTVTMLQYATAFSAVVNGGMYHKPQLIAGTYDKNTAKVTPAPDKESQRILKEETAAAVREMVITALRETGALEAADKPGYKIGGKSGTSQIIDPKTGKYSDKNAIGTYVGFGGNETPKYVIMVRVEDAKIGEFAGSDAAAPIFADISNWLLSYYKIPPIK